MAQWKSVRLACEIGVRSPVGTDVKTGIDSSRCVSRVPGDLLTDDPCHSRCESLKNTHCWMTMSPSIGKNLKLFTVMMKNSRAGRKTTKQAMQIAVPLIVLTCTLTIRHDCLFLCLYEVLSQTREFLHIYGDVIITSEGLQIWTYTRHWTVRVL